MRGISMSRVSTSGFRALIMSRATSGSGAAPTVTMSLWALTILDNRLRISAESSTTSTFVFATIALPSGQANNSISPPDFAVSTFLSWLL